MSDLPPVWLLDVDGVINAICPGWGCAPVCRSVFVECEEFRLRWAAELVRQIRQLYEDDVVELRWCTSWCPWADVLERLWGWPELGRALDAQVMSAGDLDVVKANAALAVIGSGRRLIWTDDRAVPLARGLHDRLTCGGRGLLIAPDPRRGLLPQHIDLIEDFASRPSTVRREVVLPA